MRYRIIRRRIRIILLVILLVVAALSGMFLVYRNVFIQDKEAFIEDISYGGAGFSYDFGDTGLDKEISLDIDFLKGGYILSKLNIEELNIGGVGFSADFFIKGKVLKEKGNNIGFEGKGFSRKIAFGSRPPMAASMSFKIAKDVLEIESLRLGKSYELKGRIGLADPYQVDLRIDVKRADIRRLALMANVKNPDIAAGIIKGFFNIKGPLSNLVSEGILESKNGKIGPVKYDLATVRLEGLGPIINIVDSNLAQGAGGTLTVEGYIDLRNIKRGNLFNGLRVRSDITTIVWDGWDITKNGIDELSMTKDINENMRVGFRTIAREPLTTYYDRENPEEMSLEYRLGKENIRMKLRENEEFFGIERNIKF